MCVFNVFTAVIFLFLKVTSYWIPTTNDFFNIKSIFFAYFRIGWLIVSRAPQGGGGVLVMKYIIGKAPFFWVSSLKQNLQWLAQMEEELFSSEDLPNSYFWRKPVSWHLLHLCQKHPTASLALSVTAEIIFSFRFKYFWYSCCPRVSSFTLQPYERKQNVNSRFLLFLE